MQPKAWKRYANLSRHECLDDLHRIWRNVPFKRMFLPRNSLKLEKNGTQEGVYTIRSTGPKIGDILSYNGKTQLEYWGGDYCNKIDGTDGYFFRPGISENSTLKIFYPELCRSVYLKFKGVKNYKGISVDKFSFTADLLEDPRVNKDLKCFCSKPIVPTENPFEGCLKKGFIDYASCKQESPLLVSYPHFLHADDEYISKVDGLKPDKDKHETEFLIEPKTGKILSATRKFQFNIKMRPLHNVEYFKNTSFMIFPVFNTYRSMIVPESIVEKVKEEMKLINETGVETDAAEDYPQDEPIAETTSKNKDAAIAEPEPESEAEPGSDKKKLGQDDHDYRHHHHHDHDHNELGHGHVHGSQGRNVVGGSTSAGSVSKFEAVTWMITTLTSLGLVMNQNGILAL
ncbi:Lysosome membrane protein 2 [Orchesella cincta]|uniref:Lysosome membrane protein 2 n=2 Tax=Orchesella cincta TaxID=48709 RepID=A0A1D2MRU5_ORCCI|nr:Lysosome membrane protein 2 [Orchesella cincta]